MPNPRDHWHPRSCDTTTKSTTGFLTNNKGSELTGRGYPTGFTTAFWAFHIVLLILLLDCSSVTSQNQRSRSRRTDIDVIQRFHLEKFQVSQPNSLKHKNKQAFLRKEAKIAKSLRRLRLWQLLSAHTTGNSSAFSIIVSVVPDEPSRPYYLLSVHDSKKRMQLGVKVFPSYILISYKKHHRKLDFREASSAYCDHTTFALLFKDGSVGLYSDCGESVSEKSLVGMRVREILSSGQKCKVLLGRHRSQNTAFEGSICQLTMHRGEYAAHNYCKLVRRRCQPERRRRMHLKGRTHVSYVTSTVGGSGTIAPTPSGKNLDAEVTLSPNNHESSDGTSFQMPLQRDFKTLKDTDSNAITADGEIEFSEELRHLTVRDHTFLNDNINVFKAAHISSSPEAHDAKLVSRDINEDVRWHPKIRLEKDLSRFTDVDATESFKTMQVEDDVRKGDYTTVKFQLQENRRIIYMQQKQEGESSDGYDGSSTIFEHNGGYLAAKSQRPGVISASIGLVVEDNIHERFDSISEDSLAKSIPRQHPSLRENTLPVISSTSINEGEENLPRSATTDVAFVVSDIGYNVSSNGIPDGGISAIGHQSAPNTNHSAVTPELRTIEIATTTYKSLWAPEAAEVTTDPIATTPFVTPTLPSTGELLSVSQITTDPKDAAVLVATEKDEENDESSQDGEATVAITIGQVSYKLSVSKMAFLLCNDGDQDEAIVDAAKAFCARRGPKGEPGPRGPPGASGKPGRRGRDGIPGPYGPYGMPGLPGDPGPKGQKGDPGSFGRPGFKGIKGDKGETGAVGMPGMVGSPGEDGTDGSRGAPGYTGAPGRNGRHGANGFPGRQGELGPAGRPGIAGPDGEIGITGLPGLPGLPGVNGEIGLAGKPGTKGMLGPLGMDGARGIPGTDGMTGPLGNPGAPGLRGPRGDRGAEGPRGAVGTSDLKGYPGDRGPPGLKGDKGYKGDLGRKGNRGKKGLKGDPGERGPSGKPGRRGRNGTIGEPGPEGLPGDQGLPGLPGHHGKQGISIPGEKGYPGQRGEHGLDGKRGLPGDAGEDGASGAPGLKGRRGKQGLDGKSGQTGNKGDKGDTGKSGVVGNKGSPGIPGLRGPPGIEGYTGNRGQQGKSGSPGEKGPTGHQGIRGAPGPIGAPGPVGSVGVTGPPGPPGKIGLPGLAGHTGKRGESGTPGKIGPRGDQGEEGEVGPDGERGDTGEKGPQGYPGDRGNTGVEGDKGPIGYAGEPGVAGTEGDLGDIGPAGPDGVPGLRGMSGENGLRGEKGEQGVPGIIGREGIPGADGRTGDQGEAGKDGKKGKTGDTGEEGEVGSPGDIGQPGGPGLAGPRGFQGRMGRQMKAGPPGDRGKKGEKGTTGRPGRQGVPGTKGVIAKPGLAGLKGLRGDRGPQGPTGERGTPGSEGLHGFIGQPGPSGKPGYQGSEGEQGIEGEPGEKGKDGDQGLPGPVGHPGFRGESGDPGDNGLRGPRGPPGLDGERGKPGHSGERGKPGVEGDRGDPGPDGEKGEVGTRGKPGSPGTVGRPGDVGKQGTRGNQGARGPRGRPGIDGSPGPQGNRGEPGVRGEIGLVGSTAADGLPGRQGEDGPPGLKGLQGEPGPRGVLGLPGWDGVRGNYGPLGKKGYRGPAGEVGERGTMGWRGKIGPQGIEGDRGLPGRPGPDGLRGSEGLRGVVGESGLPGVKGVEGGAGWSGSPGTVGIAGPRGRAGKPGPPGPPGPDRYVLSVHTSGGAKNFLDRQQQNDESAVNVESNVNVAENYDYLTEEDSAGFDYGFDTGQLGREIQLSLGRLRDNIHHRMRASGWTKQNPATTCQDVKLSHSKLTEAELEDRRLENGIYWIDPNEGCVADAFQVQCAFSSEPLTCLAARTFSQDPHNQYPDFSPDMERYFRQMEAELGLGGQQVDNYNNAKGWKVPLATSHVHIPHLTRSQKNFLHMRSVGAEQTVYIKCRDADLWTNDNSARAANSTIQMYSIEDVRLQSWNNKPLNPVHFHNNPTIRKRSAKSETVFVTLVSDQCGAMDGLWRGAILRIISFAAELLPVTKVTWPKTLEPDKAVVDLGRVCFK